MVQNFVVGARLPPWVGARAREKPPHILDQRPAHHTKTHPNSVVHKSPRGLQSARSGFATFDFVEASAPIIRIQDGVLGHKDNVVLSQVNLTIHPGEFIYLIGKTGTGKSSFLKTLYADIPLIEGTAEVCGTDLNKLRRRKVPLLRRKLGIVFQDFELLSDRNVLSNLDFVLRATGWKKKAERKARAEEVLELVGLGTKGYKMPHELSGGEQQRVAIARALLNQPELILADEPTGNLDPETTEGILQLLYQISQEGTAVIMATHDYAYMKRLSTHVLVCQDGRLRPSDELNFRISVPQ